jgi:HSP20 family protein
MNELMNWDPFQELDSMQDRMMRLFNRAWSGQMFSAPATDVYEEDGKLVLETALPNFKDEEVEVNLNQDRLEIKAEHKEDSESKDRNYLRRESSVQSYYRQFALPKDVDGDSGNASFEDGVLRVSFDRKELPQPKKLELKKGSGPKELPEEK